MFQVFARSFKGLNLSPGERAFMKLVEGWLLTALGAGGAIAYQLLMSGSADYVYIFRAAGGAALLTLLLAFKKYFSSQSDLPLPVASLAGQVTDVAIMEVQKIVPGPGERPADTPPPMLQPAPPYIHAPAPLQQMTAEQWAMTTQAYQQQPFNTRPMASIDRQLPTQ